jgi:hypothetical protein
MKNNFKTFWGIIFIFMFSALILVGCGNSGSTGTGTLNLSLTDAPAADNFSAVNITFSKVTVNQSSDENVAGGWITLSDTPQTIDLLTLNNGTLQKLGVQNLSAGQYNQIRFYVTSAQVVLSGETIDITLPSNMFRTVGSFTISNGVTTNLVVDFNVAKSINKNGEKDYSLALKPTTRLTKVETTGSISGVVKGVATGTLITVSTTDANGNDIATVCNNDDGTFKLSYLPAGTYDLTIEANGYVSDDTQKGIVVTTGENKELGTITLTATTPTP